MRKSTTIIGLNEQFSASSRFILNQLVVLVLCSFALQSFYLANGSFDQAILPSAHQITNLGQHYPNSPSQIQSPIPAKSPILVLEAELTNEDDEDRRNTVSNFCKSFSDNLTHNTAVYNSSVKHRFLQLNSQVNNRPTIAFFILYHSWKSDLS
jgi:hypothetical protein